MVLPTLPSFLELKKVNFNQDYLRQKSNNELFALRNLHLGFRYFLPSILWFGYRYFRNYIVLFLEKHLVGLVNFLRVVKHRSKNRYNHD